MSDLNIPLALFDYSLWADERLFQLCDGLSDEQLDATRELGFGSLRNTLFHILAAEEIWLERWTGQPWRAFEADANGLSPPLIRQRLLKAHHKRAMFLRDVAATWSSSRCEYTDASGNQYCNILLDVVIHVANHGIHHRAQALNFLKQFDLRVPGGLDFLFYRLAKPSVQQSAETTRVLRHWGVELETEEGEALVWDANIVERYFAYGDWANERILRLLEELSEEQLDSERRMGVGTVRRTALHILDAERWWLRNWTVGGSSFEKLPSTVQIGQIRDFWGALIQDRNRFIRSLDAVAAQRVVDAMLGSVEIRMPVIDALVQLCGHGTHHRSQLMNMIRHSGIRPPSVDYVVWVRDAATSLSGL
ncbi:MAG: DinB family protein [Planctomycetota bacterium]